MSESDIDMDRAMQGIDDADSHVQQITWTNCADAMPPDDETIIFRSLLIPKPYPCKSSVMKMFFMDDPQGYLAQEWTLYTPEKWKELNHG